MAHRHAPRVDHPDVQVGQRRPRLGRRRVRPAQVGRDGRADDGAAVGPELPEDVLEFGGRGLRGSRERARGGQPRIELLGGHVDAVREGLIAEDHLEGTTRTAWAARNAGSRSAVLSQTRWTEGMAP